MSNTQTKVKIILLNITITYFHCARLPDTKHCSGRHFHITRKQKLFRDRLSIPSIAADHFLCKRLRQKAKIKCHAIFPSLLAVMLEKVPQFIIFCVKRKTGSGGFQQIRYELVVGVVIHRRYYDPLLMIVSNQGYFSKPFACSDFFTNFSLRSLFALQFEHK